MRETSWLLSEVAAAQADLTTVELGCFSKARAFAYFMAALESLPFENFSILDIGCGSGHYGEFIHTYYPDYVQYKGIDYSERMISVARARHPDCQYEVCNFFDAPIKDYDVIFTSQTIEYLEDPIGGLLWLLNEAKGKWIILHKLRWEAAIDYKPKWILEPTYCGNKERIFIWEPLGLVGMLEQHGICKTVDWGNEKIFTAILHKEKG